MFKLSGTKQLRLSDGSLIKYELIKKSRRSIGIKITPKGLVVYSPLLMTKYRIDQLLQTKSKWIQKNLLLTINDETLDKIGFWRATGNYLVVGISVVILFIGLIMIAFTSRKQGLHNLVSRTIHLKNK